VSSISVRPKNCSNHIVHPGPDFIKLGPSAQFFLGLPSQKNFLEKMYIEGNNKNIIRVRECSILSRRRLLCSRQRHKSRVHYIVVAFGPVPVSGRDRCPARSLSADCNDVRGMRPLAKNSIFPLRPTTAPDYVSS
jgi:hypothetical protein